MSKGEIGTTFWRDRGREILFPLVTGLWALLLRSARPLFYPDSQIKEWRPGQQAVILAPHPDDETVGAGGVAALHAQHGDPVTVVVVTDGRASQAGGYSPDVMARRRGLEARAAAVTLGLAAPVMLNLPERSWSLEEARGLLQSLVAPAEVVYTPACIDFHPDHLRLAQLVAELVEPGQVIRQVELGVPLTPVVANLVADIHETAAAKSQALACYETQRLALSPLVRLARYRTAVYGLEAAEAFWELPAETYRRIVTGLKWNWQSTPFRGLRPRPFSDLSAFLVGHRSRRWLNHQANQWL